MGVLACTTGKPFRATVAPSPILNLIYVTIMAKKCYRGVFIIGDRKIFQIKYVVSGDVIECYRYEKNQFKGFEPNNTSGKNKHGINEDLNRVKSMSRARKEVMRSINANRDLDKFFTLTFAENITDLDYSNKLFKDFIKRLNYNVFKSKKSLIKYVAVIEFQERGAVHYHVLANLPYIVQRELQDIWGHGFVWINKIKGDADRFGSDQCDNVGAYVCKYMTKDNKDERLKGRNTYLMSRNLDRPVEVYVGINEKDLLEQVYGLDVCLCVCSSAYNNEYTGTVIYNQYNLKRIKNQLKNKGIRE